MAIFSDEVFAPFGKETCPFLSPNGERLTSLRKSVTFAQGEMAVGLSPTANPLSLRLRSGFHERRRSPASMRGSSRYPPMAQPTPKEHDWRYLAMIDYQPFCPKRGIKVRWPLGQVNLYLGAALRPARREDPCWTGDILLNASCQPPILGSGPLSVPLVG